MPKAMTWIHDRESDLHRASFGEGHELFVARRNTGGFDAMVTNPVTGDVAWASGRVYEAIAAAKRGAVAAAKRLSTPLPVDTDENRETSRAAVGTVVPTTPKTEPEEENSQSSSIWTREGGRLVARPERADQSARCAILPLDPGHYLGYIRIRETVLRIDYSNLMEAKRGLIHRAKGLLDQLLPEGMYAGGSEAGHGSSSSAIRVGFSAAKRLRCRAKDKLEFLRADEAGHGFAGPPVHQCPEHGAEEVVAMLRCQMISSAGARGARHRASAEFRDLVGHASAFAALSASEKADSAIGTERDSPVASTTSHFSTTGLDDMPPTPFPEWRRPSRLLFHSPRKCERWSRMEQSRAVAASLRQRGGPGIA